MKYVTNLAGRQFEVEIDKDGNLRVNGEPRQVDFHPLGPSLYSIIMNNRSFQVVIDEEHNQYNILMVGRFYEGRILDERALLMAQRRAALAPTSGELRAPMPGLILAVKVEPGQKVRKGDTCIILESMKMQNELKSPVEGIVETIAVAVGQTVEKNALLATIAPPTDSKSLNNP